jgi:hypothetical protein
MKVPGFTAEASLYKSTHHYAIATYAAESALTAAVQPQWSPPISWCGPCADGMRRCIYGVRQCGYDKAHCGQESDSISPNYCCWLNLSHYSMPCFQPIFGLG